MRACLQRVSRAKVTVDGEVTGEISLGMVVLLGVSASDSESDLQFMIEKVVNLRFFEDPDGKMNLSIQDVKGEILVVSQFTLYGDCRKGRRPSFVDAAGPEKAEQYYDRFVQTIRAKGITVATGRFRAHMDVELVNDGPVTLLLDSESKRK